MGLPKQELGKALESLTAEKGTAVVKSGDRTFVVVELGPMPVRTSEEVYDVSAPDEVADILDALDDTNNPSYTVEKAIRLLNERRTKR